MPSDEIRPHPGECKKQQRLNQREIDKIIVIARVFNCCERPVKKNRQKPTLQLNGEVPLKTAGEYLAELSCVRETVQTKTAVDNLKSFIVILQNTTDFDQCDNHNKLYFSIEQGFLSY